MMNHRPPRFAFAATLAAAAAALSVAACADEPSAAPGDAGINTPADSGAPGDAAPADVEAPDLGVPDAGAVFGPITIDLNAARAPDLLSTFNFIRFTEGHIEHNPELFPYDLNTALFSDSALKDRAVWIPSDTSITYQPVAVFDFPVGSAVVKSFMFPADMRTPEENVRLIETRVLIRFADGWRAFPYLWREDGSDADYKPGGAVRPISFIDRDGVERTAQYLIPQRNQCKNCHEQEDQQGTKYLSLIGLKARHINRERQLERLDERGWLSGLPVDSSTIARAFDIRLLETTSTTAMSDQELEKAARDYLDINCAHCHNPHAVQGVTSQLFLNADSSDLFRLGICKEPGSAGSGSAGLRFDIVPGAPDQSIMVHRIETEMVGEMMPLLGRSLRDRAGTPLVRGWIERMTPDDCE